MGDTKSMQARKERAERRELVKLAVEELMEQTGKVPSCRAVASLVGKDPDSNLIRRDWDALHGEGVLPRRPGPLPKRTPGMSITPQGGGSLIAAEALLRSVITEIGQADPEYRAMTQKFTIEHLDNISRLAEEAMTAAMGTTVDDLIDHLRKEER